MKILVFIKEVPDVRIPIECEEVTGRFREDRAVTMLNPPDRSAIETAVGIKSLIPDSKITVVHLGGVMAENLIREAIALGCDKGVLIRDEGFRAVQPRTKALIFARVARILGFDLILTGSKSLDTGNNQTGVLLASDLNIPCITSVMSLDVQTRDRTVLAKKRLSRGSLALISSTAPLVIVIENLRESSLDPSLSALLQTNEEVIVSFDLSDLGIPKRLIEETERDLSMGPLRFPQSKLKNIPAPDSALPGFMRIRKLVEGTVKMRDGRLVEGPEDFVVDELFTALLREGCLDHLSGLKRQGSRLGE